MRYLSRLMPVVLLLALASCGQVPLGGASVPSPSTQPAQPSAAAGDGVLVTYHKSGGIASIDETMMVREDGTLELRGRNSAAKQAQVAPSALDTLKSLLTSPEFAGLQSRYNANGNDLYTYTITLSEGGESRTVVTMDGAQNPAVLTRTLEELEKLRTRLR